MPDEFGSLVDISQNVYKGNTGVSLYGRARSRNSVQIIQGGERITNHYVDYFQKLTPGTR